MTTEQAALSLVARQEGGERKSITPSRSSLKKVPKRPPVLPKRTRPVSVLIDDDECGNRAFATGDPKYDTECPGAVCPCAERIGNMSVLLESADPTLGGARRLWIVAGPYWPMMLFFTLPAILGLSIFVTSTLLVNENQYLLCGYWILTLWVCGCLLCVGLSDPGIVPYHAQPPPGCKNWPFSQQAKSFRPPNALYSRDCNVVVEAFDHTCPWTGTAIGRKNIRVFRTFIYSMYCLLICDIVAAVHAALPACGIAAALVVVFTCIFVGVAVCACFVRAMADDAPFEGKGGGYGAIETAKENNQNRSLSGDDLGSL